MITLKWSIIQLQKFRDKGLEINETVDAKEELIKRNPEIRNASPIHVTGRADVGSQRATFHLHLTGTLVLPCARTLEDVDYPVDIRTTETYVLKPADTDMDNNDDIHQIEGDVVDVMPVIYELLLLEVPMQVFSKTAQEAESLPSGNDWEVLTEDQLIQANEKEKEKIDPRMAGLAKLFEEKD